MELKSRIAAFVQLGKFFRQFTGMQQWQGYEHGISKTDFEIFTELIEQEKHFNGWFTPENIHKAMYELSEMLEESTLQKWLSAYPELAGSKKQKTVALIMAGNIPLVGFHDLLCVLITGNKAIIKLSSEDQHLLPFITDYLIKNIEPEFAGCVKYAEGKLEHFDAVIATGSDNTSGYFEQYFGKYPHIIRKSRTSVAVLDGTESENELALLGNDIFDYYGLGCRNVSKLFVPSDFDLDRFFGAIFPFAPVINHKKYFNNYEYNKAIYLMNQDKLIENGFLLLKEDTSLHSPLAVMFYERYDKIDVVKARLEKEKEGLQCVVGHDFLPFGKTQSPEPWIYADNIDTISFLENL